ncbi:hypothetical protein FQA39_LY02158 [Lamprigera yunnana]|nr:hypothetical protein FQA39_LY02158 [Lamprigera yunnana]
MTKLKRNAEKYQNTIKQKLDKAELKEDKNINDLHQKVIKILEESTRETVGNKAKKKNKLSEATMKILEKRRQFITEARPMANEDITRYKKELVETLLEKSKEEIIKLR